MSQIKCPNCGEVFNIDESDYELIKAQIRSKEFDKEVNDKVNDKINYEISKAEKEYENNLFLKDKEILILKEQIAKARETEELKIKDALSEKNDEISNLRNRLALKDSQNQLATEQALKEKDNKIAQIMNSNAQEFSKKELQIRELENKLKLTESIGREKEEELKRNFEIQLKAKQDEVDFYKDFKAKQSTKSIGESLENHCYTEFSKLRPLFPRAYFDKDNEVSRESGSKGDFIFRDYDEEGVEITSIMFEMKNENDTTATKHKNEDFLKELDKDRREKGCEYAVLVSMLEADSELYNVGIVDVSYRFPKMYVVRPQFFIPIITLIRNSALNTVQYKKELEIARNQDIDLSHFEENMNDFKEAFGRNYRLASDKFKMAIEEIDKTIDHLEKTKKALLTSENNLRLANNKAQEDLTIKKLTKNAASVAERFKEAKANNQ